MVQNKKNMKPAFSKVLKIVFKSGTVNIFSENLLRVTDLHLCFCILNYFVVFYLLDFDLLLSIPQVISFNF